MHFLKPEDKYITLPRKFNSLIVQVNKKYVQTDLLEQEKKLKIKKQKRAQADISS